MRIGHGCRVCHQNKGATGFFLSFGKPPGEAWAACRQWKKAMQEIDLTGLSCPMPLLKTKKKLKDVAPGEELKVLVTDPNSATDLEKFCEKTGHVFVSCKTLDGGVFEIVVRHHD